MADTERVSIQAEAARVVAVVERARSLFGSANPAGVGGAHLQAAAQSVTAAGAEMSGQAGRLVDRHAEVVHSQDQALRTAGRTDNSLQSQLDRAAQITTDGARRMDAIVAQTRSIADVAAAADTPAAQMQVLQALRAQVAQSQSVVASTQQQASESAGQVRSLSYGTGDVPLTPADTPSDSSGEDPPHGKDPRYWLDVTKIVHVPDGELAPANSIQVGPNLWYPAPDNPGFEVPPPPPAQYPLDLGDVRVIDPESGVLYPHGYQEIAPGIGVPYPDGFRAPTPWPTPEQPIDVRDIIEVGPGQLAPSGYVEYFPGWWVPDPAALWW